MSVTFAVDTVDASSTALTSIPLADALNYARSAQVMRQPTPNAFIVEQGPSSVVRHGIGMHPLAAAVHYAFAKHYPLRLTPDAVWVTIAQGFALHIRLHAEALRERFVSHRGRRALYATLDRQPSMPDDWSNLVSQWSDQIAEEIGEAARVFVADFSTSGDIERTASRIVMMDAFERYYSYMAMCICGIPEVTLEGTPADWQDIRRRIEWMAGYGLDTWLVKLREICDELVATASGHPDRDFWQCIYKPREVYGGSIITGWISRLYPYVERDSAKESGFETNRALTIPPSREDLEGERWFPMGKPALTASDLANPRRARWFSAGISLSMLPSGLARVPVTLTLTDRPGTSRLELLGGLVGVTQDSKTGALAPAVGWAVGDALKPTEPRRDANVEAALDELARSRSEQGAH